MIYVCVLVVSCEELGVCWLVVGWLVGSCELFSFYSSPNLIALFGLQIMLCVVRKIVGRCVTLSYSQAVKTHVCECKKGIFLILINPFSY